MKSSGLTTALRIWSGRISVTSNLPSTLVMWNIRGVLLRLQSPANSQTLNINQFEFGQNVINKFTYSVIHIVKKFYVF